MALVNLVELETARGLRSCELHHLELATAEDLRLDLLAVSALSFDLERLAAHPSLYATVEHTLLGALFAGRGIDVAALRRSPVLDLRAALGCWISSPIEGSAIARILCVEDIGARGGLEEALADVFVALTVAEAKGLRIASLGLPVLGTGAWRQGADTVMRALLSGTKEALSRLEHLQRVVFFERDAARIGELDRAMNEVLGRVRVSLPRGAAIEGARREILAVIERAREVLGERAAAVLPSLHRVVTNTESRSYEVGIMGRRLVEAIVTDVGGARKGVDLWKRIDALAEKGVADWIRSYLHTVRILGNEGAHDRSSDARIPANLTEGDLAIAFFCLHRLLTFWIDWAQRPR
jgi:hypothetical protein